MSISSDEEIPRVDPCVRYVVKRTSPSAKARVVIKKVTLESEKDYTFNLRRTMISKNDSLDDSNLIENRSIAKNKLPRRSEKLDDKVITELLCDSESEDEILMIEDRSLNGSYLPTLSANSAAKANLNASSQSLSSSVRTTKCSNLVTMKEGDIKTGRRKKYRTTSDQTSGNKNVTEAEAKVSNSKERMFEHSPRMSNGVKNRMTESQELVNGTRRTNRKHVPAKKFNSEDSDTLPSQKSRLKLIDTSSAEKSTLSPPKNVQCLKNLKVRLPQISNCEVSHCLPQEEERKTNICAVDSSPDSKIQDINFTGKSNKVSQDARTSRGIEKSNESECSLKRKQSMCDVLRTTEKIPRTPRTPSQKYEQQFCSPSMPTCKREFGTPQTPLQEAMTKLLVSAVPKFLPCREVEFANIHNFLKGKILDGAGGCIYVSGVPGTGKTATVREVVRSLKEDVNNDKLPDFRFIEVNGMRLSHPRQSYVQIWKSITGDVVTAEQAQRLLENRFTKNSKKEISTVLLVDEVDVLWTRRQDVVYNLLDWPLKTKSHLVVVTIANTMDLPERLLMGRVTSRLGFTRLTFQPYTHKQLEKIVRARLVGINAFDADAIQFISRKVASVSGDARRALDICRRATEIAEQESPQALVTIKHIDEAMVAMTSSNSVQAIVKACSTLEKLFLQAVDAELTRTGLEETTFSNVFKMMETLCSLEGFELPSIVNIMRACMKLSSMRLLLSQHCNMDIYSRIFLNVSGDDLHYALKCSKKDLLK